MLTQSRSFGSYSKWKFERVKRGKREEDYIGCSYNHAVFVDHEERIIKMDVVLSFLIFLGNIFLPRALPAKCGRPREEELG